MESRANIKRGFIYTLLGGIFWGFSGACGQYLFAEYQMKAEHIMVYRTFGAGIIMLLITLLQKKKEAFEILKNKKDLIELILFSVFGLLFCQYSYLKAISYSNAGTATVLEYLGPVLIIVYVCLKNLKLPKLAEFISIILATLGTFILATHGDINNMVLSEKGLSWGLISAVGLALYTMIPVRIIKKYGSMTVLGYGLLIAGFFVFFMARGWNMQTALDLKGWLVLSYMVIMGTVMSFALYLQGVGYIGAVKASMVASIEPVSATVFAVLWLGSSFQFMDIVGFICIIATVFILAKSE